MDTYLSTQVARLRGRIGPAKACKAVEHSVLVAAFHVFVVGGTRPGRRPGSEPPNMIGAPPFTA